MFLKLTELSFDLYAGHPPKEQTIFIKAEAILKMTRDLVYTPDHEVTTIYLGCPHWPKVKETPEEIMAMVGQ